MLRTLIAARMILVTSPTEAPMALEKLQGWDINAWQIGISEDAREFNSAKGLQVNKQIAVLLSGRGSNFESLLASSRGSLGGDIDRH